MFMDADFDLSASVWSREDLDDSRFVYQQLVSHIGERPLSRQFAKYWNGQHPSDYGLCIHISFMLRALINGTEGVNKSRVIEKARELIFSSPNEEAFDELLHELEVGYTLEEWADVLLLSPSISDDHPHDAATTPRSVDYAVQSQGNQVFYEATVFLPRAVENYLTYIERTQDAVNRAVRDAGLVREIHLVIPWGIRGAAINGFSTRSVINRLKREEEGAHHEPTEVGEATLRWGPRGTVLSRDPSEPRFEVPEQEGIEHHSLLEFSAVASGSIEDRIFSALQGKLREKRRQWPVGAPTVLCLNPSGGGPMSDSNLAHPSSTGACSRKSGTATCRPSC